MARRSTFQSAPALSSGRYTADPSRRASGRCFNPRPPFRAGDTVSADATQEFYVVSIRARPFERAIPRPGRPRPLCPEFQSAPALSSGRYQRLERAHVAQDRVSIRARPFERAIPAAAASDITVIEFQSAPALSSGRYMATARASRSASVFQSAPALSSGRYRDHERVRPPAKVSIRARPFERAIPHLCAPIDAGAGFQSAPALSSGRY